MEPKFQSSFIPKGPVSSSPLTPDTPFKKTHRKSLFGTIAALLFTLSVLAAGGLFGYKIFLDKQIEQMGSSLERAKETLQPEVIDKLVRLDNRILSTNKLVSSHRVIVPLFEFLEEATLQSVRFSEFSYMENPEGLEVLLKGEARGYAALALQSEAFNNSGYFSEAVFSNLSLNQVGNVTFSFKAKITPSLLSYEREVVETFVPPVIEEDQTSTSTSDVVDENEV